MLAIVYLYRKFRRMGAFQACKSTPNSRYRSSSCLLAVLAMFLNNSSP